MLERFYPSWEYAPLSMGARFLGGFGLGDCSCRVDPSARPNDPVTKIGNRIMDFGLFEI